MGFTSSAWSTEVIFEFIEHYKTEQLLWDPRHPHHRNRNEVNDAWIRIQSALSVNYSVEDLKKKKESLMTAFRMHWNRKKKTPGYKTSWFAYSAMESFLSEKYDCDSSTNDLEQEFFNNTTTYNESSVSDHQYSGHNFNERSHSTRKTARHQPIEIKVSNVKSTEVYKKQNETIKTEDKDEEDEYDLYGQLLAKKLRKLDEHQRDVAMHEIDNVMFRVKMQGSSQMQQPSRRYSSSPTHGNRKVKSPLFIVTQQTHSKFEDESIVYEQDPMQDPS